MIRSPRLALLATVSLLAAAQGCASRQPADVKKPSPIPDLRGTWAFVTHVRVEYKNQLRHVLNVYRIGGSAENPTGTYVKLKLPPDLQKAMQDASMARQEWSPSAADLEAVAAIARTATELVDSPLELLRPDQYPTAYANTPEAPKSRFLLFLTGGGTGTIAAAGLHFVTDLKSDDHLTGYFRHGAVAIAAGAPVPFELSGDFEMYRLEE
jgi:hypothetical protein